MGALEFYILTLGSLAMINAIAAMGLNLQFGISGILNLAFIALVAVGAYATGVAALPPADPAGPYHYIGGFGWVFPWDLLFGVVVTVVFGLLLAGICFTRISQWYLAVTLTAIGYAMLAVIGNEPGLFNGETGLVGIPGPWQDSLDAGTYQIVFLVICVIAMLVTFAVSWRLERSPLGRSLRAIRDDETAATSLAKNPLKFKTIAFLLGSAAAGLSGGLTALYLGAWSPAAWLPGETFLILAAVVVGGRGWSVGAIVGSVVIYDLLLETSRYMPVIANRVELEPALQSLFIGGVLLAVLWWRPFGLVPEPRERFRRRAGWRVGGSTQAPPGVDPTPGGALAPKGGT
jgi:ABC-type branched-subunit amino acid transport system permease subunit